MSGPKQIKDLLDELKYELKVDKFIKTNQDQLYLIGYESFFDAFVYLLENSLNKFEKDKLKSYINNIKFLSCKNSLNESLISIEDFYSVVKYDLDEIYNIIVDLLGN